MNKEKRIEEKVKVISDICPFYKEYGTCEQCNTEMDIEDEPCYWECMANTIIRNGYRKASDVAREIFEVTDEVLNDVCAMTGLSFRVYGKYAELKKKYTKEITEDK